MNMKKKMFVTLFVLILSGGGGGVFAQIRTSLWGRAVWTPLVFDRDGAVNANGERVPGTGSVLSADNGSPVLVGLKFEGQANDKAGFAFWLAATYDFDSNSSIGVMPIENGYVWAKPFPVPLKLILGKFVVKDIYDSIGVPDFMDSSQFAMDYLADGEFADLANNIGALLVYDYKGLYVAANLGATGMAPSSSVRVFEHGIEDVFTVGQYAVSYTIPNIVTIRAQFHGGSMAAKDFKNPGDPHTKAYSYFQGYAKLLALGGLGVIDLTATFPLGFIAENGSMIDLNDAKSLGWAGVGTTSYITQFDTAVNPGMSFRMGADLKIPVSGYSLAIKAAASFALGNDYATRINGSGVTGHISKFNIEPSVDLGVLNIGTDFALRWIRDAEFNGQKRETGRTDLAVIPYVSKDFGGGLTLRAGTAFDINLDQSNGDINKLRIALPIVMDLNF
jgi:hypothetical protein